MLFPLEARGVEHQPLLADGPGIVRTLSTAERHKTLCRRYPEWA